MRTAKAVPMPSRTVPLCSAVVPTACVRAIRTQLSWSSLMRVPTALPWAWSAIRERRRWTSLRVRRAHSTSARRFLRPKSRSSKGCPSSLEPCPSRHATIPLSSSTRLRPGCRPQHNLGFGTCTANQIVPITESQGVWQLPPGQFQSGFGAREWLSCHGSDPDDTYPSVPRIAAVGSGFRKVGGPDGVRDGLRPWSQ